MQCWKTETEMGSQLTPNPSCNCLTQKAHGGISKFTRQSTHAYQPPQQATTSPRAHLVHLRMVHGRIWFSQIYLHLYHLDRLLLRSLMLRACKPFCLYDHLRKVCCCVCLSAVGCHKYIRCLVLKFFQSHHSQFHKSVKQRFCLRVSELWYTMRNP